MKILSPLEHFEQGYFTKLYFYYYDLSLTNLTIYTYLLNFFLILLYFTLTSRHMVFNKFQIALVNLFDFLLNLQKQQNKSFRSLAYFPLIFSIFLFIFFLNFSSLSSYNVSVTGHLVITLNYAISIFFGLIIIAFLTHQLNFFLFFLPKDVPKLLIPFLVIIELLSFLIRPFSLAIRLFANMLAGHTLMGIFGNFSNYITKKYLFLFIIPFFICFAIVVLEFAVALIQTYVFTILITIYLNDILELAH